MQVPSADTEVANIDWSAPEAGRLTLRDLHAWEKAAGRRGVVQPIRDEDAWAETEIDIRRTVL